MTAKNATPAAARGTCASLPDAELDHPFGEVTDVYKVSGKMFAAVRDEDPVLVTVKCEPDQARQLVAEHEHVQPGYHTDKRHWVTVELVPGVRQTFVDRLVRESYDLVVESLPAARRP